MTMHRLTFGGLNPVDKCREWCAGDGDADWFDFPICADNGIKILSGDRRQLYGRPPSAACQYKKQQGTRSLQKDPWFAFAHFCS